MSTTLLQIDGVDFTEETARKFLHRHGHLGRISWTEASKLPADSHEWLDGVETMQRDHGLIATARLDDVTARAMLMPWCGNPRMRRRPGRGGDNGCHFPQGMGERDRCEINYWVDMKGVRAVSVDRAHALVDLAIQRWNVTAGSHFTKVDRQKDAHVVVTMSRLSPGVLGLAELSCGADYYSQLFCRLQVTVEWEDHDDGDLAEVICHELGHNLGHDHEDEQGSVMTTYAVGEFWMPTEYDVRVNVSKYGTNLYGLDGPVDPPPPPVSGGRFFMVGDLFDEAGNNLGEHEMDVRPRVITPL